MKKSFIAGIVVAWLTLGLLSIPIAAQLKERNGGYSRLDGTDAVLFIAMGPLSFGGLSLVIMVQKSNAFLTQFCIANCE